MARFDREHYNEAIALYDVDHAMTEIILEGERKVLGVARPKTEQDKTEWVA